MRALRAEWCLGVTATAFDSRDRRLSLSNKHQLTVAGLVITTGARARRLRGAPEGVHALRTLDDALRLRADLRTGGHLVVIGGGFVGAEVASSARRLGNEVTMVEAERVPLLSRLGAPAATALARMHKDNGVHVITGRTAQRVIGEKQAYTVLLDDGTRLPADIVVAGVGAAPNVEWLDGSGIGCANGVLTDQWGRTDVPGVVAAGDVANHRGRHGRHRIEHWTNARDMPVTAAKALLAELRGQEIATLPKYDPVPYVWSDQYGSHLQLAGHPHPGDRFTVEEGSLDGPFVATYRRDGSISAVLALDNLKPFALLRRRPVSYTHLTL
ncbi:NAD(P)/FAD-dependent oxidoreductase, partial [Actinomadura geliboluensis]